MQEVVVVELHIRNSVCDWCDVFFNNGREGLGGLIGGGWLIGGLL